MGRPGGGIMALRGHASIQGSTDIPTLYNILPGYLPMPHAEFYGGFDNFMEANTSPTGWWGHFKAYWVSLMKAYFGDHAAAENEFLFKHLPRIDDDNSAYWTALQMLDGKVKGYIVAGENPAVGNTNSKLHRLALAKLDWLVVRDLVEIETAAFWYDSPEIESGELRTEEIPTEIFFMPAAAHTEKDGSFTNTQRLLQWHWQAIEPKEDCRSELWFYFHLGRMIQQKLADSEEERDVLIKALRWDYPTHSQIQEPSAEAVLQEVSGWEVKTGDFLDGYPKLKDDGSTVCGCWIYCGSFKDGINQTARKKPHWEQDYVAAEWAWAWPANRRILYNRASADPQGNPWSERKKFVWWDAEQEKWTGLDVPDFEETKRPDYVPPDDAEAEDAIAGDHPFIMQADGRSLALRPAGPRGRAAADALRAARVAVRQPALLAAREPAAAAVRAAREPVQPGRGRARRGRLPVRRDDLPPDRAPHRGRDVALRPVPVRAPAGDVLRGQPRARARRSGCEHGGWATIYSSRSAIEARVLVTDRIPPVEVQGRKTHQIGLPYHWGTRGLVTGGAANDLSSIVLDPNVHIQEVKAFSVGIKPGRRPRGAALPEFVEQVRTRAHAEREGAERVEPESVRETT